MNECTSKTGQAARKGAPGPVPGWAGITRNTGESLQRQRDREKEDRTKERKGPREGLVSSRREGQPKAREQRAGSG